MTDKEAKERKDYAQRLLLTYMQEGAPGNPLLNVDPRLRQYVKEMISPLKDRANLYELLGIWKGLRMSHTYPVNAEKVRKVMQCYEGRYDDEGNYIPNSGGLLFSGLKGRTRYRLTPLQVWELALPFGLMRAADDRRREITEAVYFIPRKSSKTTLAAFFQAWFFLFEDYNNEGYCVANSQEQAKILYKLTYDLVHQLDPKEKHIRFTSTELNWRVGQKRAAKVMALTAGGKAKDGLFAGLVCADEYGSAPYVKGKSDMANLLNVVEGSMGARAQPLTVITTTAGRVNAGPFELKLRGIKDSLLRELERPIADGGRFDDDWQFAVICCPDQWEEDDKSLQRPDVWHKVNHHIGVTVQWDFYESEWRKMLRDDEKKREQICKLFNVFQSGRQRKWIDPGKVGRLVGNLHDVTALAKEEGWLCFVGMDFSRGDDLCGMAYLCYNPKRRRFFADTDMWITEKTLETNQNSFLYKQWAREGWLHVCDGEAIREQSITERLAEVIGHVKIMRIGYDPYDSKVFINYLKAWIRTLGVDAEQIVLPVKQTWGNFNSPTQTMERLVALSVVEFSLNPLLPWCFSNAIIEEDRMENVKPVKAAPNAKIDPVICLLEGLILMEKMGAVL